jgi:hypothetical protein
MTVIIAGCEKRIRFFCDELSPFVPIFGENLALSVQIFDASGQSYLASPDNCT